jgi:hypothetical protein
MSKEAKMVATRQVSTDRLLKRKGAGDLTPSGKRYGPSQARRAGTTYRHLDLTPPAQVGKSAELGLKLRKRNEERKRLPKGDPDRLAASASLGGLAIGVQRARQLSSGEPMTPRDVRRMHNYFSRKAKEREAAGFGDKRRPSASYVAWLLWGGDAGRAWAAKMVRLMDRADARSKRSRVMERVKSRLDEYHFSLMPGLGLGDPCSKRVTGRPITARERRRARRGCTQAQHLTPWAMSQGTPRSRR